MGDISREFLRSISDILDTAREFAKRSVNLSMVYAYYEIGRRIVEEEQNGEKRAQYGAKVISVLSEYLTEQYGKGYSVGNLKNIRQFYRVYCNDRIGETAFCQFDVDTDKELMSSREAVSEIGETVFSQFENLPTIGSGRRFYLSWSHYLKLMRISNVDERHFYEIEAVKNNWSLSELKRQFDYGLYQRLASQYE